MDGYFKISRSALEHELYTERPYDRWHAWEYLIAWAAYLPHNRRFMGKTYRLRRGQLLSTKRQLSRDWGWSWDRVKRFLDYLQTSVDSQGRPDPMIRVVDAEKVRRGCVPTEERATDGTGQSSGRLSGQPVLLITLCKYESYQSKEISTGRSSGRPARTQPGGLPGTHRALTGHSPGTKEEGKKGRKESLLQPATDDPMDPNSGEREGQPPLQDSPRRGAPLAQHPEGRAWNDSPGDQAHPLNPINWGVMR